MERLQRKIAMPYSHLIFVPKQHPLQNVKGVLAEGTLEVFKLNDGHQSAGRTTARPVHSYGDPKRRGRIQAGGIHTYGAGGVAFRHLASPVLIEELAYKIIDGEAVWDRDSFSSSL